MIVIEFFNKRNAQSRLETMMSLFMKDQMEYIIEVQYFPTEIEDLVDKTDEVKHLL